MGFDFAVSWWRAGAGFGGSFRVFFSGWQIGPPLPTLQELAQPFPLLLLLDLLLLRLLALLLLMAVGFSLFTGVSWLGMAECTGEWVERAWWKSIQTWQASPMLCLQRSAMLSAHGLTSRST